MNITSAVIHTTNRPQALAGATVRLDFGDGITLTVTDLRILPDKDGKSVWVGWPAFAAGKKGTGLDYQPTLTFDTATKLAINSRVLAAYELRGKTTSDAPSQEAR